MRGILVAIICAVPGVASAQGLFLQKGTSGYGADLGVSTDGGFVSVGADAGFSYRGWADAGLSVSRVFFDPDDWGGDEVGAYVFAPGIGIHPLKQSPTMPLSLFVFADVGLYEFSGADLSAWHFAVSGTLYRFFKLGASYGVIPGAQFTYSHLEVHDDYGGEGSDDSVSVALGGHFAWLLDRGYILTLTPGIELGSDDPVFLLTVGALRALP